MTRHSESSGMLRAPSSAAKRPRSEPRAHSSQVAGGSTRRDGQGRERDLPQPRRAASRHRVDDTVYRPLILAMLFVGVASIGLAIWFVVMSGFAAPASGPQAGLEATPVSRSRDGRSQEDTPSHLSADATRAAQQYEIAKLQAELAAVRQELANVSASQARASTALSNAGLFGLERPPLALILDAPLYKQERSLSCESSAAVMAANYFGVAARESEILQALPRHENPHLGFRGDVDGPYGGLADYGVYAEPIRQVLVRLGLEVTHLSGGISEIEQHIREGRPVIAWVTYGLQAQLPQQLLLANPSSQSGVQTVTMVPYEHAVLVVGYNRDGLWVNDPYGGTRDFYTASDFGRSFAYLGNMALVVGPPVADGFR